MTTSRRLAQLRGALSVVSALSVLFVLGAGGCKGKNILSTAQEVKIGQEGAQQIEHEYPVESGTARAARVRRIGERLLAHADPRPGVPYTFKVLDTKTVNAVSLPGGPVYVYSGLLDLVGDDEDALACVMGHEIGHIQARHAARAISRQLEINSAIQLFLKGQTAQIANLGTQLLNLKYSRDDEYEADRRGLSYAYKAGFDPRGLIRFFQKLQALEKGGGTPEFLRDHPLTSDRIRRAEEIIQNHDYPYGS